VKKELGQVEQESSKSSGKIGSVLSSMGAKAGAAIKGALIASTTAAATAVGATVKSAIQNFADYEQLIGGVDTLFKESSNVVQQYAQDAFKTAQISANDYMETVTGFSASLLQSLGGDTKKAAEYANTAVIDMADNANKMGNSMESIQYAYRGFARQNFSMLDNLSLGYSGTKSEMERLLKDASKLSGMKFDISSFGDIVQAIHVVQENLGITGTSAEEASKTISGSFNSVKASWQNMTTALAAGDDAMFQKQLDGLVEGAGNLVSNLLPVFGKIVSALPPLLNSLLPTLVSTISSLIVELLPSVLEGITLLVQSIITALPEFLTNIVTTIAVALPTFITNIMTALTTALPLLLQSLIMMIQTNLPIILEAVLGAILQIIQLLTRPDILALMLEAAVTLLLTLAEAIPQLIENLSAALPQIIENIVAFLTDPGTIETILGAAVTLFFALVSAVPQILGALLGAFGSLVGSLWNGITKMFGEFAGKFGKFLSGIFKGAINGVLSFIENFVNTPINLLNGFIGIINGAFGWIGVHLGNIPTVKLSRMAQGGLVDGVGTSTSDSNLVALSKGEYVIRAAAARDIGYDRLERMNDTGEVEATRPEITININGYNRSPEELANIISQKLAFNMRGVM
jgi:phage-related protein